MKWHILLGLTLVAVAAAASTNEEVPRTRARQVTRQVTNPATKPAVRSSAQPAARQPTAAAARPATKLAARPATKPTVVQATKPAARSAALPTARSVASTTVRSAAKPTTRSVGSTSVRSVAKPAARPEWPSPRTIAQPVARSVSTPLAHPLIRLAPQRPKTVVREKKTIPGPQPYQISSYDGYENLPRIPYKFSYGILDAKSFNNYGHQETSDGEKVEGSYYVSLPDGRLQTVNYKDEGFGFEAEVDYKGEAHHGSGTAFRFGPNLLFDGRGGGKTVPVVIQEEDMTKEDVTALVEAMVETLGADCLLGHEPIQIVKEQKTVNVAEEPAFVEMVAEPLPPPTVLEVESIDDTPATEVVLDDARSADINDDFVESVTELIPENVSQPQLENLEELLIAISNDQADEAEEIGEDEGDDEEDEEQDDEEEIEDEIEEINEELPVEITGKIAGDAIEDATVPSTEVDGVDVAAQAAADPTELHGRLATKSQPYRDIYAKYRTSGAYPALPNSPYGPYDQYTKYRKVYPSQSYGAASTYGPYDQYAKYRTGLYAPSAVYTQASPYGIYDQYAKYRTPYSGVRPKRKNVRRRKQAKRARQAKQATQKRKTTQTKQVKPAKRQSKALTRPKRMEKASSGLVYQYQTTPVIEYIKA